MAQTSGMIYFFDAVLRVDHSQQMRVTEHPVQTGANLVDHAYLMPARVTLEVGMSDAMDRYQAGQYTSDSSKSVSAFKTFLQLQSDRAAITLTTRLKTYNNMIIESIDAPDDAKTMTGLRARISLRQIIAAEVSTETVSVRPQVTDATPSGPVATTDPSNTVIDNNKPLGLPADSKPIPGTTIITADKGQTIHVPGAGTWSSVPLGSDVTSALGLPPTVQR